MVQLQVEILHHHKCGLFSLAFAQPITCNIEILNFNQACERKVRTMFVALASSSHLGYRDLHKYQMRIGINIDYWFRTTKYFNLKVNITRFRKLSRNLIYETYKVQSTNYYLPEIWIPKQSLLIQLSYLHPSTLVEICMNQSHRQLLVLLQKILQCLLPVSPAPRRMFKVKYD